MNLNVGDVAAQRSFIFLLCGSSDGLDLGRKVSEILVQTDPPNGACLTELRIMKVCLATSTRILNAVFHNSA